MKDLKLSILTAKADILSSLASDTEQIHKLREQLEKLIDAGFPQEKLPEVSRYNLWYFTVENCTAAELNIARRALGRLKKYSTDVHDETHVIHSLLSSESTTSRRGSIYFRTCPIEYHGNGRCKIKKIPQDGYLSLVCDN